MSKSNQGVTVRVLQRLLALTAAIWHNHKTGQPALRSLIAYDHCSPPGINHLTGKSRTWAGQAAAAGEAGSSAAGCGCEGWGQAARARVTVNPRAASWRMWLRAFLAVSMRLAW
jgi:hypothetical protein